MKCFKLLSFLVISFIQSIIKAINQSRSTQPGTGGQSTSFSPQDIELTEEGVNRTPPRNIVNIDKPILKEAYRSKVGAQTKSPNSSQGKKVGRPLRKLALGLKLDLKRVDPRRLS